MKKIFYSLLFIICFTELSKAQYVTIPDSNFAMIFQGYVDSCIVGNQLDTTCPALFNITKIDLEIYGITNLTGIQYFKNLDTLFFADSSLIYIPAFPPHLTSLNIFFTHLANLPTLPNSLVYISLEHNWLDSLPVLPSLLTYLDCSRNRLTVLPTLPSSLLTLWCFSNELTNLPELPAALQELVCSDNQILGLPVLPNSLTNLYCSFNLITTISTLPDSLNDFECGYNYNLRCLPELGVIVNFNFDSTAVQCLPDTDRVRYSSPALSSVPLCSSSNPNGCSATSIKSIPTSTLTLSPNPTTDKLYINTTLTDYTLTISDMTGRSWPAPVSGQSIDVSALPAGVYCVRVLGSNNSIVKKFVKE